MSGHIGKGRAMTREEVSRAIGDITESGVVKLENNALKKLRRSPTLFMLYHELQGGERRSNNIGTLGKDEH